MTEHLMRAKVRVTFVQEHNYALGPDGTKSGETITMCAISRSDPYPADGSDENNTFAKWSPSAEFKLQVANPALWGKLKVDDQFYIDFTPVVLRP